MQSFGIFFGVTWNRLSNKLSSWWWIKAHLRHSCYVSVVGKAGYRLPCGMGLLPYQIRKIAGCACAGNAGNVFFSRRRFQRKPLVSDPGMHHGTCVTHVPWCMSGSLTCSDGENVPGIPGACAPAILCIWQVAHADMMSPSQYPFIISPPGTKQTILWWTYHRYRWLTRCLLPQSLRWRHNCHQINRQHFQINFLVWKIYFDLDLLKSVANGPVNNNNKSTLYQILFSRIVIIWINGGLVYSRLYASPGLNGLASPLWTFQPLQGYHCLTISSAK